LLRAWSGGDETALEALIPLIYKELRQCTRRSLKRGGECRPVALDEEHLAGGQPDRDLVSLDEALDALATLDPRKGRVVELRFFGGLSVEETAEVLKVSPQTVLRDWKLAKVWLLRAMRRGGQEMSGAAES
jgi:RNA polymerase sigma factor (TIGR02999 family)